MAKHAKRVSLLFEAHLVDRLPDDFGRVLATHLLGTEVREGDVVALPGWPPAVVDEAEPAGGRIEPGTVVDLFIPPPPVKGALSLVALVDGSLTMGKGSPETAFERSAQVLDGLLLNGRHFVEAAGIVVQGGATRQVDGLAPPEETSGASILKVTPKGTFDVDEGLDQALSLLAEARGGPRAVLLFTDGKSGPKDALAGARPARRAGVVVVAHTLTGNERVAALCQATGGDAFTDPEALFAFLAQLAGTQAEWSAPAETKRDPQQPYEFEVVIEAMEE